MIIEILDPTVIIAIGIVTIKVIRELRKKK